MEKRKTQELGSVADADPCFPSSPSVTEWLCAIVQDGDEEAISMLCKRYWGRLVIYAKDYLRQKGYSCKTADEEDVVQSTFAKFCMAAKKGNYSRLGGRGSFEALIFKMVRDKANDRLKHHHRKKRTPLMEHNRDASDENPQEFEEMISLAPTPDEEAELQDLLQKLPQYLALLPTEKHRVVAMLEVRNFDEKAIADEINMSVPTVRIYKRNNRAVWARIRFEIEGDV